MLPRGEVMYSEAEAKEKGCPMSMAALGLGNQSAFCNGSICMAWRWDGVRETWPPGAEVLPVEVRVGYCGLAGKI